MIAYHGVLVLHLWAAAMWLGGGATVAIVALRTERSGDPVRMQAVGREVEWFGSRILVPSALVALVTGLVLTALVASLAEAWILIGLGLYATSAILAMVFLGPRPGVLARLVAEHGPTAAPVQARVRRHFLYNRIEVIILLATFVDMIVKPGR